MVSNRCKIIVKQALQKLGLHFVIVDLGEVDIMEDISDEQREELNSALLETGLELIDDKKSIVIEKIKNTIVQMIHHEDELPSTNYSHYISQKLNYDYTYLSNIFTEIQGITIQQFIIIHKIERVKELLMYEELNLTEISYRLQYSSVAHLSKQFKKVTGMSSSAFMLLKNKRRSPLESIGQSEKSIKEIPKNMKKKPTKFELLEETNHKNNEKIDMNSTEKNQDSQYARSLIEASQDPLFTIDLNGKIMDLNNATVLCTGVKRELLIGSNFSQYFTEPLKAIEGYEEIFKLGHINDFPLTFKDHKLTYVLFNGSVYKDEQGKVLGAVVVARDITNQESIKKELTEAKVLAEFAKNKAEIAKIKAEDAVKSKQQFLSNMSHEIRTPMNAIIGFTKVILKTQLTTQQKEYLLAIKMSGDALIVLINDILDLAKVDAGKMQFEKIPFQMETSILAMLHIFDSKAQEKNLELNLKYDSKIPKVLMGDAVRLHQIMLNLLSNAIKFTTEGTIIVSVKLIDENEDSANIKFSVSDSGIGISDEKLLLIFDNFQQASSSTSRVFGGTGLGLAIVKQLVEAQGGTISVTSKVNNGSKFCFILNFLKTTEEAVTDLGLVEINSIMKGIKVLVVEDMALNQLLMKTLLDDFEFVSDIVANGKLAIEALKTKKYDIILMDLQMPIMNGFEATEYIRNTLKLNIPIIALTADVTTMDVKKCISIGMNDYVSKPVDERILYAKIILLIQGNNKNNIQNSKKISSIEKPKCIDLEYLKKRTKSNPILIKEMILAYLEQTPPLIEALKESSQNKNWELLKTTIHKLTPSFSIIGMHKNFEEMAKKIQNYATTLQQTDSIYEMVHELESVLVQSLEELKEELIHINNDKYGK